MDEQILRLAGCFPCRSRRVPLVQFVFLVLFHLYQLRCLPILTLRHPCLNLRLKVASSLESAGFSPSK